jgi:hypothetical protein
LISRKIVTTTARRPKRLDVALLYGCPWNLAMSPHRRGTDMNNRARLIAAMSTFALAVGVLGALVVLLGSLVLLVEGPTPSRAAVSTAHDHADALPICNGAAEDSEPTFYSEMAKVNTRMHAGMDVASSGDVDRDFARMMIPHHQGAIDMALLQLKYGHDEKLKRLAQSIIVEQGQEIAYMRVLLDPPSGAATAANSNADK